MYFPCELLWQKGKALMAHAPRAQVNKDFSCLPLVGHRNHGASIFPGPNRVNNNIRDWLYNTANIEDFDVRPWGVLARKSNSKTRTIFRSQRRRFATPGKALGLTTEGGEQE